MAQRNNRRNLIKAARKQGWRVTLSKNGHLKFVPPDPEAPIVHAGGTPSDVRATRNLIADLRRTGCFA